MTPQRLQQIEQIFHDALDRNESEQMDFVGRACGEDEELFQEVISLLEAHYEADKHATQPAMELAAHEMAIEQSHPSPFPELENYDVISPLGKGGMGEVLLAKDKRLKRKVALKLLPSYYASNEERLRRFEQEAFTASALTHPNILTVYEIGQSGDSYFIATEFVEGQTLRQRIREGALNQHDAIEIAIQITNALQAAHNAGIVHRDIKPDNIMIRPDGFVKILDFGIAKLTETSPNSDITTIPAGGFETKTGQVIGTPAYLSPEQARGLKIDGRSDLFSLGVVFYEMLIGHQPFAGPTSADVMVAILERDPIIPPHINTSLKRVINKALHKSVESRYQNAEEFAKDLRSLLHQSENLNAASATTKLDIPIVSPETKRNRILLPAVLAVALAIAGIAAYRFWPVAAPPPPPPEVIKPPIEVMSYMLEISGAKNKSMFSNGTQPIAAKQDFKFHFAAKKSGFLYIIAPGKTNLPETFLTAQPQKELANSNAITSGKDFVFPEGDEYWINQSNAQTTTFSVIFSPTPLTTPAFFAQSSGRKLTISEQQEWDAFRQSNGVQQPNLIADQPRAIVSIPAAQSAEQPVIFDVTVKLK